MRTFTKVLGVSFVVVTLSLVTIGVPSRSNPTLPNVPAANVEAFAIDPAQKETRTLVDPNNKPVKLRRGEKYLAERKLSDGRIMIYRRTKGDIDALIRVFKGSESEGQIITTNYWSRTTCMMLPGGTCFGHCGIDYCRSTVFTPARSVGVTGGDTAMPLYYCACR